MPKLPKDPSGCIWLAARIRGEIDRLSLDSSTAFDLDLEDLSTQITDAALQLANVYNELIQLASPPAAPQKR